VKVFHFMKKQHAVRNLETSRLKVATLDSMNDPYEFFLNFDGASQGNLENFKEHFTKKAGFLCFSRNLNDPVQWAHYAENHRGICWEFDIPEHILQKIEYLKVPISLKEEGEGWRDNLVKATLCKYEGWSYEKEYRILVDLESEEVTRESGLHFVKLEKVVAPTRVYTGIRCKLSADEKELFKRKGLEVVRMVQDQRSFSIIQA